MRSRTTRHARPLIRPAITLVLVFAQAVAAFGFPLIRPKSGGPSGTCGGGQCGCETACGGVHEGCCCRPAPLATAAAPTPAPPPPPQTDGCRKCGRPPESCCCPKPATAPPSCPRCRDRETKAKSDNCSSCQQESLGSCSKPTAHLITPPTDGDSTPVVTWVAAWKARQCRGEGPLGLLAELPAVPPGIPVTWSVDLLLADLLPFADSTLADRTDPPVSPPPKA